jgi:hypothetical protein
MKTKISELKKMTNGEPVNEINEFAKHVEKGEVLDVEEKIGVEDTLIIIQWLKMVKGVEKYRALDSLVVCLLNGIDGMDVLAKELKEMYDL